MDCKNRIIAWSGEIHELLTEDYLISLANKGIYNRGKKDLEKCQEQLRPILQEDDTLKIQFEDGTEVTLNKALQESKCSCIAQNVCRHMMTAFLYCKSIYESAQSEDRTLDDTSPNIKAEQNTESPFSAKVEQMEEGIVNTTAKEMKEDIVNTTAKHMDKAAESSTSQKGAEGPLDSKNAPSVKKLNNLPELEALTQDQIMKYFGKRTYNEALKKFPTLKGITFAYSAFVTIKLEGVFTVYFTPTKTLEQAVCSCKKKGPCIHKLYALLAYLEKEGKNQCTLLQEPFKFGQEEESCLKQIKLEITHIVDKGLSSITENTLKKIEILYIKAYSYKFYELANELKSLSGELVYYFSRNVAFSSRGTMHLLSRIYNRCEALLINKEDQSKLNLLVGKLHEESMNYDRLHLYGLGARCFLSKRKDLLITAYFYCNETENILTMTTLRPMEQNHLGDARYNNRMLDHAISYLYNAPVIWEDEFTFEQVMHAEITLQQGNVKSGKLSTTKKSQGKILGEVNIEHLTSFAQATYAPIKQAIQTQKSNYFTPYIFNQHIYILKAAATSQVSFNKIAQRLEFTAYDMQNEEITFYVPYNSINEKWIQRLETEKQLSYSYFLGDIRWQNNHLEAQLLSIIDESRKEEWQWKQWVR